MQPVVENAARGEGGEGADTRIIDALLGGQVDKLCSGELDLVGVDGEAGAQPGRCDQVPSIKIPVVIEERGDGSGRRTYFLVNEAALKRPEVRDLVSSIVAELSAGAEGLRLPPGFDHHELLPPS